MKILIVDDSKFNLKIANQYILKHNITLEIVLCNKANQALDIIYSQGVDLVLLDIMMPEISGVDILRQIRKDSNLIDLQVLMFTSLRNESTIKTCFDYGVNDFISKPIEEIEFISRIKSAIKIRKYQLSLKETLRELTYKNSLLEETTKQLRESQFHIIQKEKLAAIGQLAAGIAHEINNPIGYVYSNFSTLSQYINKIKELLSRYQSLVSRGLEKGENQELLLKEIDTIKDLEYKYQIDFILEDILELIKDSNYGIERVTKIVSSLRNFARKDSENGNSYCDMNHIIEEAVLIVASELKAVAEIQVDNGDIPQILCERGQIGQVLINILINAIQAIKGQNKTELGKIIIRTFYDEKWVICEIEDNGPGIPETIIIKLFDPFFTTKEVGMGTGLGLSISHDIIVNKHHGEILIENNENEGAKFTLKLPIDRMK